MRLACFLCLCLVAFRADESPAPAERLALARAHNDLVRVVFALPISGADSVGAWAAEDWNREAALRAWLFERPRFGPLRRFSTGAVAADLRVDPAEIRALLVKTQQGAGAVTLGTGDEPIWVTGRSTVDEAVPPHPSGWENVAAADFELARDAAPAMAWTRLLRQAEALSYQPGMSLRRVIGQPGFRVALLERVARLGQAETQLLPYQVVESTVTITPAQFVTALQETAAVLSPDETRDFRGLLLTRHAQRVLRATAHATPPRTVPAPRPGAGEPPSWAARVLRVVVDVPDQPEVFRRPERAITALRTAAGPALLDKLRRLGLPGGATVADVLRDRSELESDLRICVSGARVSGLTRSEDGETNVVTGHVELALEPVWHLVAPHSSAATTQPASQPSDAAGEVE